MWCAYVQIQLVFQFEITPLLHWWIICCLAWVVLKWCFVPGLFNYYLATAKFAFKLLKSLHFVCVPFASNWLLVKKKKQSHFLCIKQPLLHGHRGEHNYYPWKCLELKYEECSLHKLSVLACDRSGFTDPTELRRNSKDTLLLQLMFICGSSEILQLFIQRGLPCSPFWNVYSGFCQLGLSLHTILLSPHWWIKGATIGRCYFTLYSLWL